MTKFFDINTLTRWDASCTDSLFRSADVQLKQQEISWDNCTAIGVDNTNVNFGEHDSIKSWA